MTTFEIYKVLHVEADRDLLDGWLSPKEYNYLLEACNLSFFNRKMDDLFVKQDQVNKNLLSMKFVRPLIKRETKTPVAGVIDLSGLANTFAYWWSAYTAAVYLGQKRRVTLVNGAELDSYIHDSNKPILYNPIAYIDGDNLRLLPVNIGDVIISYVAVPSTPKMDYYTDAAHQIVYLTEGQATYTLQAGEYGPNGETAGTGIDSTTIELDYSEEYHAEFLNELRNSLGLRMRDQLIVQDAYTKMGKEDAI